MNRTLALLLCLSVLCFSQVVSEEALETELEGVVSYLGILLLSFLFILVIAIPFVNEVMEKKPIEKPKSPLSNSLIIALELFLGILIVLLAFPEPDVLRLKQADSLVYMISAICALLPFSIFITISFISNIYKRKLIDNILPLVLWGVAASTAALVINQFFESILYTISKNPEIPLLLFAAFFEEAIKGLGLLEFFRRKFPPVVLAMLYGFAIGVGFSIIENWLYFSYITTPSMLGVTNWTHVLFYRSFFTNMSHGFFTAANAYVVCRSQSKHRFLIGLLVAFSLHLSFNLLFSLNLGSFGPFFVLIMAMGFVYLIYQDMKSDNKKKRIFGLLAPERRK